MLENSPKGIPVSKVAETVSAIVADPRPRYRYKLDKLSRQLPLLSAVFPEGFFQQMVLKSLKMPRKVDY